jgi:uncharacterized protein (DUF58 family)
MRPPAALLDRLTSFRLLAGDELSTRQGERRSRATGVGMEFAGSRPYREGDDLRRLDTRLFARHRKAFTREHLADRQLRVVVLIDTSPSMAFGRPDKLSVAAMLAQLLGYAALSSGDQVIVGLARGRRLDWSDAMQGSSRTEALFDWIDAAATGGDIPFAEQLRQALPRLQSANLAIIIGDWWLDDADKELRPLAAMSGSVFALQVVAGEEEDPLEAGGGPMRLLDLETNDQLDVVIDKATAAQYRAALADYRAGITKRLARLGGRLLSVRSDAAPAELFGTLVEARLLGRIGDTRPGPVAYQGPGVP